VKLELEVFDKAYISLAEDLIVKLKNKRPWDKIEIIKDECKFQGNIVLLINGKKFSFDLLEYLDDKKGLGRLNSIINNNEVNNG